MTHDKILVLLQELAKQKGNIKALKKEIRNAEKIENNDQYNQMKSALKDLKEQVKEFEENWIADLEEDKDYAELRNLKEQAEEKMAQSHQSLFQMVSELPKDEVKMQTDTEEGLLRVDIRPEMRIYINGKEEKPRLIS